MLPAGGRLGASAGSIVTAARRHRLLFGRRPKGYGSFWHHMGNREELAGCVNCNVHFVCGAQRRAESLGAGCVNGIDLVGMVPLSSALLQLIDDIGFIIIVDARSFDPV